MSSRTARLAGPSIDFAQKGSRRGVKYGRGADAIAHQAADKIREVMKPPDELGTRTGDAKVKPPDRSEVMP